MRRWSLEGSTERVEASGECAARTGWGGLFPQHRYGRVWHLISILELYSFPPGVAQCTVRLVPLFVWRDPVCLRWIGNGGRISYPGCRVQMLSGQ